MSELIPYIGHLQIRDKALLLYYRPAVDLPKRLNPVQRWRMQQARLTQYSGDVSEGCKKRLSRAVTLLVQSAEKRRIFNPVSQKYCTHTISFITLTIPNTGELVDGRLAYDKLLKPFIQWMRRRKKVQSYIWKAELQVSGQIHYHITTEAFIPWPEIRNEWNRLLAKIGLLNYYFNEHGHYDANSTDIHSVKNVKNLAAYIVKYVTKQDKEGRCISGKVWDCSENLKGKKYHTVELTEDHKLFLNLCRNNKMMEEYVADRFSIFKFKEDPQEYILSDDEYKKYTAYMLELRNNPLTEIKL